VYFLSIDNATNMEETGYISQGFLDGTPPSIVIQNPVNDQNINGTSYTITGNSSDNLSGIDSVLLSFDNGATWDTTTGTGSWSYTWSLPSNDTSIVIIGKAVDTAGNFSEDTVLVHIYPNKAVSRITSPASGDTMDNPSVVISGIATPPSSGVIDSVWVFVNSTRYTATITGSSGGDTTWTLTYNFSSFGSPFNIKSVAFNGNESEIANSGIVIYSPPYPTCTITSPIDGAVVSSPVVRITGVADQGFGHMDSVQVSTDNGMTWNRAVIGSEWYYNWSPMDEGTYHLLSRVFNSFDSISLLLDTTTVMVDLTAPVISITSPSNGDSIDLDIHPTINITGTSSDAFSGVKTILISFDAGSMWDTVAVGNNWTYSWTPDSSGNYTIAAKAIDNGGLSSISSVNIVAYSPTGIEFRKSGVPLKTFLAVPDPNIISGDAEISFGIPEESHISIDVYNISGRRVITLANSEMSGGYHKVRMNTGLLSQGVYFIIMNTDAGFRGVQKIVVIK